MYNFLKIDEYDKVVSVCPHRDRLMVVTERGNVFVLEYDMSNSLWLVRKL